MNLIDSLDIEYLQITGDKVEAKMNITQFHSQPFGYLHGGATIAFGETVAGYASKAKIKPDQAAVGQTVTAHHLKPKKAAGCLIAKGRLLHEGRSCHVWCMEMMDETNILIAQVTITNAIVTIK